MIAYLRLLENYLKKSDILLLKLCDVLQLPKDDQLFYNLLDVQTELSSILIDKKWKVRMHGQDIAFTSDSNRIDVNLIDARIITMSFFHCYIKNSEEDDIEKTKKFFEYLVQQGYAVQIEPLNGYQYMLNLSILNFIYD